MANEEKSVVFLFPLAIHRPTRLIPLYVPPFSPFFSVPLFLYSSILSRISLWTCLCQWLHQILGYATLQKYPNKFDKQIVENLKKDFIHPKREYFIILISD